MKKSGSQRKDNSVSNSEAYKSIPKAIDLFCGCGGLSLGLKQAGFKVIGAVEIDSLAAETFKENHNEVMIWETDIRKLDTREVKSVLRIRKGWLDLLAGCPPCQGFSSMRTLNGSRDINDEHNDLVFEFMRFVRDLEPKTVMIENVPGLAKDKRMKTICQELDVLGYSWELRIINAADFGVPQRRRRMILLAGKKGKVNFSQPVERIFTVRQAFSGLATAGNSGDPLHDFPENRSERIMELIKSVPKDGGGRKDLDDSFRLLCHKKCDGFKDVYGRMAWDDVAPTITGGCVNPSKGRFLHPVENRAITLREAAILQTFPPNYRFSLRCGKHKAAVMIGNALPPEMVRCHAAHLIKYLKMKKRTTKKGR
jgi:DNA (cytosine-5)-methyltransferase 1